MPTALESLFTEHVISSFDKQLHLADAHGEDDWGFDMTNGAITFDESTAYKIQILGTEDHVGETWLWGWANEASGIPAELLQVGNDLRAYGEKNGIAELTEAQLPLADLQGHTVGLIATGLAEGKAYYLCPYENGALFVLITDEKLHFSVDNKILRATMVIPQAISALGIEDHRTAVAAYLRQAGMEVKEEDGKLVVYGDDEPALTAEFEDLDRLASLQSHLEPGDGS